MQGDEKRTEGAYTQGRQWQPV